MIWNKQNIKLIIMSILGLPGLPFACLMWLICFISHNPPKPFKQAMTKEEFISFMIVGTILVMIGSACAAIYF